MLRIYLDFKSPAAYLAMKPSLALINEQAVSVEWLPFKSVQQSIPQAGPDAVKGDIHRRVRAIARRDTHLKYAAIGGLPLKFPEQPGSSDLALAALLWLETDPLEFIESAFRAYWVEGADLDDFGVITKLISRSGLDASGFDRDSALRLLADHQRAAEEAGIIDTPAYVVNEQVFIGREHLPWIASVLQSA